MIGEGGFDGVEIVRVDVDEAGEEGAEALVDFSLRGGGHGADGSAVEGVIEGDDFVTPAFEAESAGELYEAIVRFCAGVGEEDFAGLLDDFFDDEFGEVCLGDDVVEV